MRVARNLLCCVLFLFAFSAPGAVIKVVPATAGPWLFTSGGLNTLFQYGIGDQTAPTLVSSADGLPFLTGDLLTIAALSGLTNAFGVACPDPSCVDAEGSGVINQSPGSSGQVMPSYYIPAAEYDVRLMTLVGVFAGSSGAMIGAPHRLGNGPVSLVIPSGATAFQLGFNDDIFFDNLGSVAVHVSESAVPEPASWTLILASGIFFALGAGCRRAV